MKDAKYLGMVAIALIAVMGLVATGCGDKDNGGDDQAGKGGNGGKKCCGSGGKCCKTGAQPTTKPAGGGTNGGKTTPAPTGDKVALKISLPDPMFKGTPKPIKGEPNMGPIRKGKRPPFLAPKGTVNLAAGKPVKSSDPEPIIGELKYATDGEKAGGDGYFVELAPGKQWITIDLGQQSTIYAITLWHYHQQGRAYRDVVVEVAKDEDFIESTTVFNNDHDNSSGQGKGKDKVYVEDYQGKLIDCKGVQGRHIRLWSKENTTDESNHYIEVEVYGKPVK